MPSRKVEEILRNFRARFQPESSTPIPMALRQESPDVIYLSLYEEDRAPLEMPTPMMGFEPGAGDMSQLGGNDPGAMLDELLGASMGSGVTPPPELMGEAPAGPPGASPEGMPDLDALLGMM
jgi:hypothetical protein